MSNLYLSEEMYNETRNKLKYIALIILIIGIVVGGLVLYKGISIKYVNNSALKIQMKQELQENGYSEKYYELKNEIKKDDHKDFYIIYGILTILVSGIISCVIFKVSNNKELLNFGEKQTIPFMQDDIKTMASSAKNIISETNEIVDNKK